MIDHESTADSIEVLRNRLGEPGCRAAWYVSRKMFMPSFQALVEKLIAESPLAVDRQEFDVWKASLARQRGG